MGRENTPVPARYLRTEHADLEGTTTSQRNRIRYATRALMHIADVLTQASEGWHGKHDEASGGRD